MQFESAVELPRGWGEPITTARLKSTPDDFIVRELLNIDFDEQGEHVYLYIRKCGLNTQDVVEQLQRLFRCASVDIGVSGLKDKNAITEQWFSVRSPMELSDTPIEQTAMKHIASINITGAANSVNDADKSKLDSTLTVGEFEVISSHRHSRKLRRGAHRENHFVITLRELGNELGAIELRNARANIDERLSIISENGFVNYFGPQRFGINQQNLVKADRYFANPKRKMSRAQRSLLISSARSLLFNRVCAERVEQSNWNVPMNGEPMMLDGTQSFFINDELISDANERCLVHDIHPTGPLWGEGDMLSSGKCEQFELEILNNFERFTDGLRKAGLKQQRRALRAHTKQLQWEWSDSGELSLRFGLLRGVYATGFLSEFVKCL